MTKIKKDINFFLKPTILKIILSFAIFTSAFTIIFIGEKLIDSIRIGFEMEYIIWHGIKVVLLFTYPFPFFLIINLSLMPPIDPLLYFIAIMTLLSYSAYCYLLSCFILLFISKIRKFWQSIFKK